MELNDIPHNKKNLPIGVSEVKFDTEAEMTAFLHGFSYAEDIDTESGEPFERNSMVVVRIRVGAIDDDDDDNFPVPGAIKLFRPSGVKYLEECKPLAFWHSEKGAMADFPDNNGILAYSLSEVDHYCRNLNLDPHKIEYYR